MHYKSATQQCKEQQPGGRCPPGVQPTGAGDCTYQYEEAGEIDIDELVGITPKWKNRADFCRRCRTEGSAWKPGGCGLNFWGRNVYDKAANQKQVAAALHLFEKQYPNSTKDHEIPAKCDFSR